MFSLNIFANIYLKSHEAEHGKRGILGKGMNWAISRKVHRNASKTTQAKKEMFDWFVWCSCVVLCSSLPKTKQQHQSRDHVFPHASNTHHPKILFTSFTTLLIIIIIFIFIVSNTNTSWSKWEVHTRLSNRFHKTTQTNVVGRETWAGSRWDLVHVWGSTSSEKPLAREALRRSSSQRTLRMETM